jgi:hypothetical protein
MTSAGMAWSPVAGRDVGGLLVALLPSERQRGSHGHFVAWTGGGGRAGSGGGDVGGVGGHHRGVRGVGGRAAGGVLGGD